MLYIKFFLLLYTSHTFSQVELQTKQALNKIRYITPSGRTTYYQKNSGELQMSTFYNFSTLIKEKRGTQFLVHASRFQEKVIIEVDTTPHSVLNINKNKDIYIAQLEKPAPVKKMGKGVSARLHLDDKWLSFYNHKTQELVFKSFNSNIKDKVIKIPKKINQFFTPKTIMLSQNDILYSDINSKGHYAILLYSFTQKSFQTIYKTKNPLNQLHFCKIKNQLIIGEFPLTHVNSSSLIVSIDLYNNNGFKNITPLYVSELADIGNMECLDNKIFFIKTISLDNDLNSSETEVASLSIKDKKIKIESNLKSVTQIIQMGEMILTPFKGQYYIISGGENLLSDEIKKEEKK